MDEKGEDNPNKENIVLMKKTLLLRRGSYSYSGSKHAEMQSAYPMVDSFVS